MLSPFGQFPYFWIIVGWPEKIRNHLPEGRQSLGASFRVVGLRAEAFSLGVRFWERGGLGPPATRIVVCMSIPGADTRNSSRWFTTALNNTEYLQIVCKTVKGEGAKQAPKAGRCARDLMADLYLFSNC